MSEDIELKRVDEYASELGMDVDELMGYVKIGMIKGENHNGVWYVEPNPILPKTNLRRFLIFVIGGGIFSIIGKTKFTDFELPFTEILQVLLSNSVFGASIGLGIFVLAKINQELTYRDFQNKQ